MVNFNGYGGTDRQLFIPTVDGYYTVKDYSSNNTEALITAEAFDPNQRLVDQALAEARGGGNAVTYVFNCGYAGSDMGGLQRGICDDCRVPG